MDPIASTAWATVLAGGSGRRLSELTKGVPKQFWRFAADGTLLEATLARIAPVVAPSRTTIVVDRTHRRFLQDLPRLDPACRVDLQPCDRGTAAGVLCGMLPALQSTRDAIVVLTPSDHGVLDTNVFRTSLREAIVRVGCGRQRLVLFGAEPSGVADDYGWIMPDDSTPTHGVRKVARFVEKPSTDVAAGLLAAGAVWNTMVVVTGAAHLMNLYRRHLPDVARVFDLSLCLPPRARETFLRGAYRDLPVTDFCRDLLMVADDLWVHVWSNSLGWSDLGTPARLREWLPRATQAAAVPDTPGRHADIETRPHVESA